MIEETVGLATAMVRMGIALGIWGLALGFAVPWSRAPLVRGLAIALVSFALAGVLGPSLWHTYDSTVDLAIGQRCALGTCPTQGVLASQGNLEGGVVWDWILGAAIYVADDPRWLRWLFIVLHAGAAGIVALVPERRWTGVGAGVLMFGISYGLAPGYIVWHPTLAPVAVLPAVLLAVRGDDAGDRVVWRGHLRAALLGAAFGVGLGVYIAALIVGPILILGVLRGRTRRLPALGLGLVAEQALVTPEAALNNLQELPLETFAVGIVLVVGLVVVRRWLADWVSRSPATVAASFAVLTLVSGALITGHGIYPFYLALLGPLVALAFAEESRTGVRTKLVRGALVAAAATALAGATWFYRTATEQFHEGHHVYGDLHGLGPHFKGAYGANVTTPGYAVYFSLALWAQPGERSQPRGIAIWGSQDPDPGLCLPGTSATAGELSLCEYEPRARTSGSSVCPGLLSERVDPPACVRIDGPDQLQRPLLSSPIQYPRNSEPSLRASVRVPVCLEAGDDRVFEPFVFAGLPVRPHLRIREPTWGRLIDDGAAVRVSATEPFCDVLEWELDGRATPLVPWADDSLPAETFDHLLFFVGERAG